jgi:hypothetical protein
VNTDLVAKAELGLGKRRCLDSSKGEKSATEEEHEQESAALIFA